jgi:hypothetical protein
MRCPSLIFAVVVPADGADYDDATEHAWFNEDGADKKAESRTFGDGAVSDGTIAYG